jgi:hypothetical protein
VPEGTDETSFEEYKADPAGVPAASPAEVDGGVGVAGAAGD